MSHRAPIGADPQLYGEQSPGRRGQDRRARRHNVINKFEVDKHLLLEIGERSFAFSRNALAIPAEAVLNQTSVSAPQSRPNAWTTRTACATTPKFRSSDLFSPHPEYDIVVTSITWTRESI